MISNSGKRKVYSWVRLLRGINLIQGIDFFYALTDWEDLIRIHTSIVKTA